MVDWIPWGILACNIGGVVMMLRYGLPEGLPFGRQDGDILGIVGLVLFGFSIAARISTIMILG